jgi:hypothetical protein
MDEKGSDEKGSGSFVICCRSSVAPGPCGALKMTRPRESDDASCACQPMTGHLPIASQPVDPYRSNRFSTGARHLETREQTWKP